MGFWGKSRGEKLRSETESLLKKSEKVIGRAKKVDDLEKTIVNLSEKALEVGKAILEITMHSGNLVLVQLKLTHIADEVREILAAEEQPSKSLARIRILRVKARKLKVEEVELLAKLAEFKKEEIKIEALEEQQRKLQEMLDKATKKSSRIVTEMTKDIEAMSEQTSLIFDEAMGNMFEKP